MNPIIPTQSEYSRLIEEIHAVQARISELTALRDDLLYHICPALRAEYEEKIGSLEREMLAAQLYLQELQRTVEILQAQLNRQEKPDVENAKEQAHEEYRQYQEDLNRQAKEAEDFNNYWKNDTNWSKYGGDPKEEQETVDGNTDQAEAGKADGTGNAHGEAEGSSENHETSDAGDSDGRSGEQAASAPSGEKTINPAAELKKLYKEIVKLLHPDVNKDITEREKELFNRAVRAYKAGDLEEMRRVWEELRGMEPPEEQFKDTPEGIEKLKEMLRKLNARVCELQEEIRGIRSDFPYNMKSFLQNEEAVKARRDQLQAQLKAAREMIQQLVDYINELRTAAGEQ